MKSTKTVLIAGLGAAALVAGLATTTVIARDGHGYGKHNDGGGHHGKRHHRGHGKMRGLRHADVDGNGEITLDEVEATRAKRFAKLDTDGDGSITQNELMERAKARALERIERRTTRKMRRLDENRDGKVTPEEFARFAKQRFTWSDLNDDGKLTSDELPGRRWRRGGRKNR